MQRKQRAEPTRQELIDEIGRLKFRKAYYKAYAGQVVIWQLATGLLSVVVLVLLGAIAFGDETPAGPKTVSAPIRALPCPDCEMVWATERPQPIKSAFQVSDYTPDYILASVHMANNNHCSGTVIGDDSSETALIVSAAHCVAGNIGNSCWWHLPTGKPFRAELIAYDRSIDVSVFRVPRSDVLAVTKLVSPRGWIADDCDVNACGYPGGAGPNLKSAAYCGEMNAARGMPRWCYTVKSGTFRGGDSGCGLFYDGLLAGVVTHTTDGTYGTMMTVPQPTLFRYVSEIAAAQLPDVPIATQCRPTDPRGRPPAFPPDDDDEQAPAPPPGWKPKPNVPINPPATPDRNRIRDADRDAAIEEIRNRLDTLNKLTDDRDAAGNLRIDELRQQNGLILGRLDSLENNTAGRFQSLAESITAGDAAQAEKLSAYLQQIDGSFSERLDAFKQSELSELKHKIGELDATTENRDETIVDLRARFEAIRQQQIDAETQRRDADRLHPQRRPSQERAPDVVLPDEQADGTGGTGGGSGGLIGGVGKAAATVGTWTGNPLLIGIGTGLSILTSGGIGAWLGGAFKKKQRRRRRRPPAVTQQAQGGPADAGTAFPERQQQPGQVLPRATVDLREQLQLRELEGRSPILDAAIGIAYSDEIANIFEGKGSGDDGNPVVDLRSLDQRIRRRVDDLAPLIPPNRAPMR